MDCTPSSALMSPEATSCETPSLALHTYSLLLVVADLEKILGGAFSLHLLPIPIPFKVQWLQIYRRGSMLLARVGGALAPANPLD